MRQDNSYNQAGAKSGESVPHDPSVVDSDDKLGSSRLSSSLVITIDGGAGTGKTSVAELLGKRLGLSVLDSGKWYRAIALLAHRTDIDVADEVAISELAGSCRFFPSGNDGHLVSVVRRQVDGRAESFSFTLAELDDPHVGERASFVAKYPMVRHTVLLGQWELARDGIVTAGRAQGTEVFGTEFEERLGQPVLRFLLSASIEIRALRRFLQVHGRSPANDAELSEIYNLIKNRDIRDS